MSETTQDGILTNCYGQVLPTPDDGRERKTIGEWNAVMRAEGRPEVMDPDGFDRGDPGLYHRRYTRAEFEHGALASSCMMRG